MKPLNFDDFPYHERELNPMERKHLQGMQQITPKLFIQFLSEKGAKGFCLSCGHQKLFVPHTMVHSFDPDLPDNNSSTDWEYLTPSHKDNEPITIYNTRYEVTCSHCGFISTYSAHAVIQWAKDNGYIVWEGA
ncbi:hypothetical protein Q0L23_25350 [Klebsiella michiganensis]|uniref:hypothetical protein n=1 Tax=Klebsiella michiganensis TaxID=1134687 RepID=UPI00265B570D|nr:hypothetical protein [Klebsiella michiganensis]WKK00639.1 hypothetical protein Q0L46_14010 [Klebsiella michiganensis]WKK03151.1 hypothetical protein Q0L23_25350 [Klebsiella michiganensis]